MFLIFQIFYYKNNLSNPRNNRVPPDFKALNAFFKKLGLLFKLRFFNSALEETIPLLKTNDPTPRSIRDVPQVSTLANLLGKIGKSTAKMAIAVRISIPPRYAVIYGFFF
ncbi:Gwt1p [Saccharomyces cerevisiae VL3]|nr:Gwt1p [Saccharomyces cerevisiae VL3]